MEAKPVTFVPIRNGNLIEFTGVKAFLFSREHLNPNSSFVFEKCLDKLSENNLIMVDSNLPEILGEFVSYMLNHSIFSLKIKDLAIFHDQKGLFKMSDDYPISFYNHKMKSLIRALVLGMNNKKVWFGEPNLYDYYPVLRRNDELVYFGLESQKFIYIILESLSLEILSIKEKTNNVVVDLSLMLNHRI